MNKRKERKIGVVYGRRKFQSGQNLIKKHNFMLDWKFKFKFLFELFAFYFERESSSIAGHLKGILNFIERRGNRINERKCKCDMDGLVNKQLFYL